MSAAIFNTTDFKALATSNNMMDSKNGPEGPNTNNNFDSFNETLKYSF